MFPCDFHFKTFVLNEYKTGKLNIRMSNTNNLYQTEFALIHYKTIEKFAGRDNVYQLGLERYCND
jgi:hypothetical protein